MYKMSYYNNGKVISASSGEYACAVVLFFSLQVDMVFIIFI